MEGAGDLCYRFSVEKNTATFELGRESLLNVKFLNAYPLLFAMHQD
jgi:hypothetical protein